MSAYYGRTGARTFEPSAHAGGAWSDDDQHFSPFAGLVAHAIEGHVAATGDRGLNLGRISYDILGRIPMAECEITVETIRPGRTIELVEARAVIDGRPVVNARAWYSYDVDTGDVAGGEDAPLPDPSEFPLWDMTGVWPGGYIGSITVRRDPAARRGRGAAWVSTDLDLVEGEAVETYARYLMLVDTANGIAVRSDPTAWMFPNIDLTAHLHRRPDPARVGFDTTVTFGSRGQGLTSSILHDIHGPVGVAQQSLTIRPQG